MDAVTRLANLEAALAGAPAVLESRERALAEAQGALCEALGRTRGQAQSLDILQQHYRGVAGSVARLHPEWRQSLNDWVKLRPLRPDEERARCAGVRIVGR